MDDDLQEIYTIESLEQLRVISDELRVRIIQLLRTPHTVTQIADKLKMVPAKVHYHVRELDRLKLIKLVETREKGGILEKYYQAIAKNITVSRTLFSSQDAEETITIMLQLWNTHYENLSRSLRSILQNNEDSDVIGEFSNLQIWVTKEEYHDMRDSMQKLLEPYQSFRAGERVRERMMVTIAYDAQVEQQAEQEQLSEDISSPRIRKIFIAGILSFQRNELENAIAQNEQLAITVIGICRFANDVTPEFIEAAIHSFVCQGVLDASDAVRAALKKK